MTSPSNTLARFPNEKIVGGIQQTRDQATGLTTHEVSQQIQKFGLNEIINQKTATVWNILFSQFASPLVYILIGASILCAVMRDWIEFIAIVSILTLNALIGFFQEYSAEKSILALKGLTSPHARVLRDGQQGMIPAIQVVPGDLIYLEAGDVVAADGNIIRCARLKINEAILTGESLLVEKNLDEKAQVFMGTSVATGTAQIKVSSTGMHTELGKIARLIATAESPKTPLQLQLLKVGKALLIICLIVIALVVTLGWLHGRPWMELIIFSISLAVAVVPEGMPALATVALALGVRRMARENALVRKLPSVETLGSVSVICTDKTGTLTTGEMRVREVLGFNPTAILNAAASCCDAELGSDGMTGTGDSTEIAILIEASSHGVRKAEIEKENPRILELPFDSIRKRMSIQRKDGILYVKGAFESVIPNCINLAAEISNLEKNNNKLTSRGLRVLVIATGITSQEENLTYLGMIGIADPPRKEVKQAILEARQAGIKVVMITGDHLNTAVAIAKELGILQETDKIDEFIHARATPEDKLKIIRSWKAKGEIVAMTGDGVNDAPALKEAHIGVAMGKTGTEVTRQAADLILADDRFSTIILAVKEGRGIYTNIRKALKFLLAGNCGELFVVLGASIMGLPLPFLAVHLLWINLVTDSLPALALIMDPISPTVMKVPPRPTTELLLGLTEWKFIGWVGALEGGVILLLFFYTLKNHDLAHARNLVFPTLVFSQLLRSTSAGAKSNIWLIGVILFTATAQISLHFIPFGQNIFVLQPLTFSDLSMALSVSLIPLAVIIANKWLTLRSSPTINQKKLNSI